MLTAVVLILSGDGWKAPGKCPTYATGSYSLLADVVFIHTNPADAKRLGIQDGEYVDVRVGDEDRGLTFGRTLVRVGANSFTEVHIDTDEANAAGIEVTAMGQLVQN